jgi:hypothetical protein
MPGRAEVKGAQSERRMNTTKDAVFMMRWSWWTRGCISENSLYVAPEVGSVSIVWECIYKPANLNDTPRHEAIAPANTVELRRRAKSECCNASNAGMRMLYF